MSSQGPPPQVILIINLEAGRGRARRSLAPLVEELSRAGLQPHVHITQGPQDASRVARDAVGRYPLVVAAGGDGTVNEVINGIAGSGVALGIAPLGHQNVLAHEFGIPENPREAARVICGGAIRTIDLGRANGRYFALMAGVGFDAYVASRVKPELKKLFGSGAYILTAMAEALSYDPEPIRVVVDGEERVTGYFVVVGNARYYTSFFELSPQADMTDGLLEICVFKNRELLHLVKYLLATPLRPVPQFADVEHLQGRTVELTSPREVLAHVDCEILGTTPIEIQVAPAALPLLVPPLEGQEKKGRELLAEIVARLAPEREPRPE